MTALIAAALLIFGILALTGKVGVVTLTVLGVVALVAGALLLAGVVLPRFRR